MELYYLRGVEKRDLDFLVVENKNPAFAVECKISAKSIQKNTTYFKERISIPKVYQVHLESDEYTRNGVHVLPVLTFCKRLKMP